MSKFLLLNSPIYWDAAKENEQYLSPLGLGYIATYLEKAGVDVVILDCVKERKGVPDILAYINNVKPEYVGINIFTQNYQNVQYIIENIRINCECFVGGQVVKSIYQEIWGWNVSNKLNIIIGEGELIIPQIVTGTCRQKPEKQDGIKFVYRVNNDSEYFPANISNIVLNRKYLGDEIILNHYGQKEAAIITSRGCAFDCAFCGGARGLNEDVRIRFRTEESVIEEIEQILNHHPNVQSIRILDDLFLRNGESIDRANRIFGQFPGINWRGMVHVLSLVNAADKIKELPIGRCKELFIGIESGSETIRKKINKLGSSEDIIQVSEEILKNGIDLKGYFIYGFPKETKEDFEKTYNLAKRLKDISQKSKGTFRTSVFQFRPYHGTQLYNELVSEGRVIPECEFKKDLGGFEGRAQFNFSSGNYSAESDELLNEYIIKTQELTDTGHDRSGK